MDTDEEYFDRLVDTDSLRSFLAAELGTASTFDVEHLGEGHSNETLFVTWDDRELVVRRPPPGETAETAHDVLREYRVMDALQGGDVPVPTTVAACTDHDVIGSDFFVMDRVAGEALRDAEPARFRNPDARQTVGEELVDTLADVHSVDVNAVGLDEFGHPEGYTQRQVDRWVKQLDWAFDRTDRRIDALDEVGEWLAANAPDEHPHTLVHCDYKLDNVMFGPGDDPEIVAVLDWEMSTLGDPLADLGWMLAFWHDDPDRDRVVPELVPSYLTRPGYPDRDALVERYERHTGIEFERPRFYVTLALYKLAALGEMFYARYLNGDSDDPMYPAMEHRVPALGERAADIVAGEDPL